MPVGDALPRLTSLRFFAAAGVVFFHLDFWGVVSLPGFSLGYVGVAFFFTLSGLVLAWGTGQNLPARTFYRRRFARIWPSHAVMLVAAAIVPVVPVAKGWVEAVPNLLLIQAWWLRPDVVFGMNGVSWSLSCEAFFYATFPFAVVLLRRLPRVWRGPIVALALMGDGVLSTLLPDAHSFLPIARYGEFLLGMMAGVALRDGWRPRIPLPVAFAAVAVGLLASHLVPYGLPNAIMAVPFLVALLAAAGRDLEGRRGWLTSRPMIFAGEASFSLYLVHELVIHNMGALLHAPGWATALAIVIVTALAAVALHLLVERPCNRLLRGRSRSVALAPPAELSVVSEHGGDIPAAEQGRKVMPGLSHGAQPPGPSVPRIP